MNGLTDMVLQMMDTTPDTEDYMGADGLLYCGKYSGSKLAENTVNRGEVVPGKLCA